MFMTIDRYAQPGRDFHVWNIPEWKRALLRLHDSMGRSSDCGSGPSCWQTLVVTPVTPGDQIPETLTSMFKRSSHAQFDLNTVAPLPSQRGSELLHCCREQIEHWGTHGTMNGSVLTETAGRLSINFTTVVLPADEAVRHLSASYPDLLFTLTHVNRAQARAGEFIFLGGNTVSARNEGSVSLERWLASGGSTESYLDEFENPWTTFAIEAPSQELLEWADGVGLNYHQDRVMRSLKQPLVRTHILSSKGRRRNEGSRTAQMTTLALGAGLKLDRKINLAIARQKSMSQCVSYPANNGANDRCRLVDVQHNEDWVDEHLVLVHASNWIRHHASNYDQLWKPVRNKDLLAPAVLKARVCHLIGNRFPQAMVANEAIAMGVKLHNCH